MRNSIATKLGTEVWPGKEFRFPENLIVDCVSVAASDRSRGARSFDASEAFNMMGPSRVDERIKIDLFIYTPPRVPVCSARIVSRLPNVLAVPQERQRDRDS